MCWPEEDEDGAKKVGGGPGPGVVLNVVGSLVCMTNFSGFLVTNQASLYTFCSVRHVSCIHTVAVRFGRYTSGTYSVCALPVR